MTSTYRTTTAVYIEECDRYDGLSADIPDPVAPDKVTDDSEWVMIGSAVNERRLFWFWELHPITP